MSRKKKKKNNINFLELEEAVKLYFAYKSSKIMWDSYFEGDYFSYRNSLENYPKKLFSSKLDVEKIIEEMNKTEI